MHFSQIDTSVELPIMEQFYTIQGEGHHSGRAAYFIRIAGCDVGCVWCDVKESWDSQVHPLVQISDLVKAVKENNADFVVITGGEPLLGWQKSYPSLLEDPRTRGSLKEITFETNGTQELSVGFYDYLFNEFTRVGRDYDKLTFSVSPKLSVSGEKWEDAIKPDIVKQYEMVGYTYLKFVVANEDDVKEAEEAVNAYRSVGFGGPVYIMPCGGEEIMYNNHKTQVAELAMKKGWRYSERLQIPLFKNAWGT